jgi:predicted ATPase
MHLERLRQLQLPAIVFSPSLDHWNDFGYRTRFSYQVLEKDQQRVAGDVHLAFLEEEQSEESSEDSPAKMVMAKLRQGNTHLLPAREFPMFYTIHHEMNSYREIVRNCGPARAQEILLVMNDLVAVRWAGRLPKWFNQATTSRFFTLAFVRNAETFFAFHNAASILGGLEQESFEGLSKQLRLKFKLDTFQSEHELQFSFDPASDLPKRIAVIIGKNGVGKSQSLAHFAQALLRGTKDLRDGEGNAPVINRLLAVSSPGETKNTFPRPPKEPRIFYKRIILSRNFFADRQSGMGDVLLRLARARETIKQKSRWELFCQTVGQIVPTSEIAVPLKPVDGVPQLASSDGGDYATLENFQNGGEQNRLERWARVDIRADVRRLANGKLVPLSSGQLTFIRFAANACLHIENGTMVLFDEPETHLHPNYVSDFIRLLDTLLVQTGSFAILATHSAYFVRTVPNSQVIILTQERPAFVTATTPRLKTLGADIGAISSFVFGDSPYGDDSFGNIFSQLKLKLQQAGDAAPAQLQALANELPAEAIMYLRRAIAEKPKV